MIILLLIAAAGIRPANCRADNNNGYLLAQVLSASEPVSAWISYVDQNGEVKELPAIFKQQSSVEPQPVISRISQEKYWSVLAQHPQLAKGEEIVFIAAVQDAAGNVAYSEVQEERITAARHLISADGLRERLLIRKQELNNLRMQFDAQEDSLKRLRADADIIANLGRIVDLREEAERIKKELTDLDHDIISLNEFIGLVRNLPAPGNLLARERQLGRQLQELAEATKKADAEEFSRRSATERELQDHLALVELARHEDLDAMQRELVRLRKRRIELQRRE